MGKAVLFLVVLVVAGFGVVLWLGMGVKPPTTTSDGEFNPPSVVPNLNLKENAQAAADKAAQAVKTAARDAGMLLKQVDLKFEKPTLEVKAGGKADIKIIRAGGDLSKPMKLELLPAPNSSLIATGGEFKANETTATVTIEAPAGAHDASVTIKGGDATKLLPVHVQ